MRSVSISQLKAHLSENLRYVERGERVVVTDRGRPIAVLGPVEESGDDRYARLVAEGVLIPPKGPLPDDFWDLPRPKDPDGSLRRAVIEERESGW